MKIPAERPDLVNDIKHQLDHEADHVPADISAKLDAARRQALAETTEPDSSGWWKTAYTPALAAGLALAVFIGVINTTDTQQPEVAASSLQAELEVVLTNEDFELMEEDLEFYLWLEQQAETG